MRVPKPRSLPRAAALGFVLLVGAAQGCRSTDGGDAPAGEGRPGDGAPIELSTRADLLEIARHEAGRSFGDGLLVEALTRGDATARERAAIALGRLPLSRYGAEVTQPLCAALSDPEPAVRAAAAFALGLRADPTSASALLNAWNDDEPAVRRRIVQAASRFQDAALRQRVVRSLADPDLEVACLAAIGTGHWRGDDEDPQEVDRALVAPLGAAAQRDAKPLDPELRWRLLWALQHRRATLGRGAFLEHAGSAETYTRLFAVRGLAGLREPRPDTARALEVALADPDWRVVCAAARGLAAHRDPASVPRLVERASHLSPHVRRSVIDALASFPNQREAVLPAILRAMRDASPGVRAAALVALVSVAPQEGASELEHYRRDDEPILRAAVARAAAKLEPARAIALLLPATLDPHPLVASAALEALGEVATPPALTRIAEVMVGSKDLGLRLVALTAFRRHATQDDAATIARAVEDAEGDIAIELWLDALGAVRALGGPAALALANRALQHPWYAVHDAGRALLADLDPAAAENLPAPPVLEPIDVPVPGKHLPLWTANPMVAVDTTRGRMVFELFPAETPLHVYNFLEFARRGHYDGLSFHRVEPDFVIQGGDPRGDGAGGTSWRGTPLVQEFTPRSYVRGSLGMPRSDHPDSGGCQIFVTHRPTPHLDARYTVFGELRRGFDVLDRIEIGDRILGVRRLD